LARATTHFMTHVCEFSPYRRGMDEAREVRERLERIDTLRAAGGPRAVLLAEVRALLADGERCLAAQSQDAEPAPSGLEASPRPPERATDGAPPGT
jgi:hypothetical protein